MDIVKSVLSLIGKNKNRKEDVVKSISLISTLTHEINEKKEKLDSHRMETILNNKNEYYISLEDLLLLMDCEELDVEDVVKKCKHLGELQKEKVSYVEVYATTTTEGVLLSNVKKDKSDKIKIVTVKKNG